MWTINHEKYELKEIDKKDIFYLLLYFFVLPFIIYIVFDLLLMNLPEREKILFIGFEDLFYEIIFYSVLGAITYKYYKRDISNGLVRFKENWLKISLIIIMFFIVDNFIESIMNNVFYLPVPENQEILNEVFMRFPIVESITTALFAPIIEEMVFRHILIGKLSKRITIVIATILSIFLFAFVHTGFSVEIIQYLPGSIILTILYLVSDKNIAVSIIYHILWNTVSIIGMFSLLK